MKSSYIDAIVSLVPNAQVSCNEDTGEIVWHKPSSPPVTESQIDDERLRLGSIRLSGEYERQRAKEYPPITDYLDAVVKGDQAQIAKYIADCQAVKAKYPKPE